MIWAVRKYGIEKCEAVFCDTGWENPVTYQHIKETTKQMGVKLSIVKSQKYDGIIDLAKKKKRFPSTNARFCTEELKVKPAIDFVLSHTENVIIIEGIRKSESRSRAQMSPQCTYFKYYFEPYRHDKEGRPKYHAYRKKDVLAWSKKYNADKIRPIFEWSAEETLDFIRDNGQMPNPLYYQGFSRVGCFPCVMCRHKEVKLIIENHPKQWEVIKRAEKDIGSTFFPPSYIPKREHTGMTEKGQTYCTAKDIERYFRRKNATLDMFDHIEVSCMSVYNLCE